MNQVKKSQQSKLNEFMNRKKLILEEISTKVKKIIRLS